MAAPTPAVILAGRHFAIDYGKQDRRPGEFLEKMKKSSEGERTLLDSTAIFCASNLGNASSHDTHNLPVLLAGGGFKHKGHVAYDRKNNKPLSNLFVRMLQQMGIEMDRFGSSTGALGEV